MTKEELIELIKDYPDNAIIQVDFGLGPQLLQDGIWFDHIYHGEDYITLNVGEK